MNPRSHTHTHTQKVNNTPDTDTQSHDKNNTTNSQTNTPYKRLTTGCRCEAKTRVYNYAVRRPVQKRVPGCVPRARLTPEKRNSGVRGRTALSGEPQRRNYAKSQISEIPSVDSTASSSIRIFEMRRGNVFLAAFRMRASRLETRSRANC